MKYIVIAMLPFLLHCSRASEPKARTSRSTGTAAAGLPAGAGEAISCLKEKPLPLMPPMITAGVVVTKAASRVRLRHEKEARYAQFGGFYWDRRSFEFIVEDYTLAGEKKLVFTWKPTGPILTSDPGLMPNLRVFDEGTKNLFHHNVYMEEVAGQANVFQYTLTEPAGYPELRLDVGRVIEFEFGVFFDREKMPLGDTNYYSDTFRVQLGAPGVKAGVPGRPGGQQAEESLAAGGMGIAPLHVEAERYLSFSQNGLNVQLARMQSFLEGRALFHTNFQSGQHTEKNIQFEEERVQKHRELSGPDRDALSCSQCHNHNGRLEKGTTEVPAHVLKVADATGLNPHPIWGSQIQANERTAAIARETRKKTIAYADGTKVELTYPHYQAEGALISARIPPQVAGLGLLEAIRDEDILQRAACDPEAPGISGRAAFGRDPVSGRLKLGRFGWKAGKVSLLHQVAEALQLDLAVANPLFPGKGAKALNQESVDKLNAYVSVTALPSQRNREAPAFARGEKVFQKLACSSCHVPQHLTGGDHPFEELRYQAIRPFTDLLLHDMGEGLADQKGEGLAKAGEWRTPPLWGLGLLPLVNGEMRLLHDGRAKSHEEAILWHGGEAAPMQAAFLALPKAERDDLFFYLQSI